MANKPKSEREIEAIVASGFAHLHGEASRLANLSFSTLKRRADEGRLRIWGSPLKVDVDHLFHQCRHDFPLLEDSDAA